MFKKALCVLLMLCLLGLTFAASAASPSKEEQYEAAVRLIEEGRYDEAEAAFRKLGKYEDSKKYADYAAARALQASGEYLSAQAAYKKLGKFADSADRREALNGAVLLPMVKDGLWGLVSTKGKWVLKPAWGGIFPVNELADNVFVYEVFREKCWDDKVTSYDFDHKGAGIILADGTELLPCVYASLWLYRAPKSSYVFALNEPQDGKEIGTVFKWNGASLVPIADGVEQLSAFGDDFIVVRKEDKYGLLKADGSWLGDGCVYAHLSGVGEGLIAVQENEGDPYGYCDLDGNTVLAPQWDEAGAFSCGLAPASSGGKWGYITPDGKWKVKPKYAYAAVFQSSVELAVVTLSNGTKQLIGPNGKTVGKAYDDIEAFTNGVAVICEKGKKKDTFGLINAKGKVLIKPDTYTSIDTCWNGAIMVGSPTYLAYHDANGKKLISHTEIFKKNAKRFGNITLSTWWYQPGYYGVSDCKGSLCYLNKSGKLLIDGKKLK